MVIELTGLTTLTKQMLKMLAVLSCCFFAFIPKSPAIVINELTAKELNDWHQCEKTFEYDIYFLGTNVGYLQRTIKWHKNTALPKATITSFGEVTFLWLDSTYQQKSTMQYSPEYKHFLTEHFSQRLTGIKARKMTATMSNNGLSSTVTLNTEESLYQNTNKNEHQPLYDLDTLGAQIRLNLIQEKTRFPLSRQASSKIESYQFEVSGLDVINHEKWGKLTTIKVIEVGEHESIVLWFSAKHDHQLIKAELDMMFSPVVWLANFSMHCDR